MMTNDPDVGADDAIEINFVDCAELRLDDEEAASKSLQAGGDEANDPDNTHTVEDIHFYAMVRSVATGRFFTLPTLWSFLTLAGQIIIFTGLFVAPGGSIIGDAGRGPTWAAPDADDVVNGRTQYETAYFTVMIFSAFVLVVKAPLTSATPSRGCSPRLSPCLSPRLFPEPLPITPHLAPSSPPHLSALSSRRSAPTQSSRTRRRTHHG